MSTAMLAQKMNKVAPNQFSVMAKGEGEFLDFVADQDIVMVAPQIRYLIPQMRKELTKNIPVIGIDPRCYGLMRAQEILAAAQAELAKSEAL